MHTPTTPTGYEHSYQSYVCRVDDGAPVSLRDDLMAALGEEGIAARQGTHAVHTLDCWARTLELRPQALPHSWAADRRSIALPLFADLTDSEQDRVVETLLRRGAMLI